MMPLWEIGMCDVDTRSRGKLPYLFRHIDAPHQLLHLDFEGFRINLGVRGGDKANIHLKGSRHHIAVNRRQDDDLWPDVVLMRVNGRHPYSHNEEASGEEQSAEQGKHTS